MRLQIGFLCRCKVGKNGDKIIEITTVMAVTVSLCRYNKLCSPLVLLDTVGFLIDCSNRDKASTFGGIRVIIIILSDV